MDIINKLSTIICWEINNELVNLCTEIDERDVESALSLFMIRRVVLRVLNRHMDQFNVNRTIDHSAFESLNQLEAKRYIENLFKSDLYKLIEPALNNKDYLYQYKYAQDNSRYDLSGMSIIVIKAGSVFMESKL